MRFEPPLVPATLIRRYKRFLADVALPDGTEMTVHCANPGAMLGLDAPGLKIWLQDSENPKRKLRWSWRLADLPTGALVGIDTSLPNRLVAEALAANQIPELSGAVQIQPEQNYHDNSRIDFLLTGPAGQKTYLEVKNVHFSREPGLAEFPDCKTERGTKHLHALADMVSIGHRAVMLYLVQRTDCAHFRPASDLDPAYAQACITAQAAGVEILVYDTAISPETIRFNRPLPYTVTQTLAKPGGSP